MAILLRLCPSIRRNFWRSAANKNFHMTAKLADSMGPGRVRIVNRERQKTKSRGRWSFAVPLLFAVQLRSGLRPCRAWLGRGDHASAVVGYPRASRVVKSPPYNLVRSPGSEHEAA